MRKKIEKKGKQDKLPNPNPNPNPNPRK